MPRWMPCLIGSSSWCLVALAMMASPSMALAQAGKAPGAANKTADEQFDLPPQAVARLGGSRLSFPHVVNTLAISPDGRWIAAGGLSSDMCLFEVASGRRVLRTKVDGVQVGAVAFSPDGKWLAAGGVEGTLSLIEVPSGKIKSTIPIGAPIDALATSTSGRLVLVGCASGLVGVFDAEAQQSLASWDEAGLGPVSDVAFGPEDRTVLSISNKGNITCWDIQSKQRVYRVKARQSAGISLKCSAERDLVVAVSGQAEPPKGALQILDAKTGQERKHIELNNGQFRSAAFTPDAKNLTVTVSRIQGGIPGCSVELIDWMAPRRVWQAVPDSFPPKCAALSNDGKLLAVGGQDELIKLFDVTTGKEIFPRARVIRNVLGLEYSPSGRWLAVSSGSMSFDKLGRISLWEVADDQYQFHGHIDCSFPLGMAFSDDNQSVLAAHFDATVSRRDIETGKRLWVNEVRQSLGVAEVPPTVLFDGPAGVVYAPQMSGEMRLLDAKTGADIKSNYVRVGVMSAAISPARHLVAIGGSQGDVVLWDTDQNVQLSKFSAHEAKVSSVAMSARGDLLVSGSMDKSVRVWNLARPGEPRLLAGHKDSVLAVAMTPNGALVASGDADGDVRLWDAARGSLVRQLKGHEGQVTSLRFSPDGRHLAGAGLDGKVIVWAVGGGAADSPLRAAQRPTGTATE